MSHVRTFGYRWYSLFGSQEGFDILIAVTVFLTVLLAVHSPLFFILLCTKRRYLPYRRPEPLTPRIMYLPTGEAVVVLAGPLPPKPTHPPSPSAVPVVDIYDLADMDGPRTAPPIQQQRPSASSSPPARYSLVQEPFRRGLPPRKPVPGSNGTGTYYPTPWPPPDYEPDPAERARAESGESQAQGMTLVGSHVISEKL